MGGFFLLLMSIGVAVDASNLGYDKDDVPGFAPGPAGWFFFMLFLWFIALPVYLVKRPALKAAAEQRRLRARTFAGALPGAVYPYGPQPNPYGGPPPYGAPGYGAPPPGYGAPPPAAPPYGAAPGAAPNPYGAPPPGPYGAPPPASPYGAPPQGPGGASPYGAPPQGPAGYPGPPPPANPYAAQQPNPAPPSPGAAPAPGAEPASPAASEPGAHKSSSGSMTAGDLAEGIRKLTDLRDRGLLTESEFQARKLALLDKV